MASMSKLNDDPSLAMPSQGSMLLLLLSGLVNRNFKSAEVPQDGMSTMDVGWCSVAAIKV